MQQTKAYSFDFRSICSKVRKALAAIAPDTMGKRGRGRPAGVELGLLLVSTIRQKLFTLGAVEQHFPVEMRRISFANVREDMKMLCALQTQVGKVITEVRVTS